MIVSVTGPVIPVAHANAGTSALPGSRLHVLPGV